MVDYATLPEMFPTKSRATLYRWRVQGKVRKPDFSANGRDYYRTDISLRPDNAPEKRKAVPPTPRRKTSR